MARRMYQHPDAKACFEQWVARKRQQEQESFHQHVDQTLPPLSGLSQMMGVFFQFEQTIRQFKGTLGEREIDFHLIHALPESWILFSDIVLEPNIDRFAQIDHVLIGSAGVFLIETKAWHGSFKAYRDQWQQRDGQHWVNCSSSPTTQHRRHATIFHTWLRHLDQSRIPAQPDAWVVPIVVMTDAQWLRATQCSMKVLMGTQHLVTYLREQRVRWLTDEQVQYLAHALAQPPHLA